MFKVLRSLGNEDIYVCIENKLVLRLLPTAEELLIVAAMAFVEAPGVDVLRSAGRESDMIESP